MKKIIILSDGSKDRNDLISHLKELFPECEIQIITYQPENIDERMSNRTKSFNLSKAVNSVN